MNDPRTGQEARIQQALPKLRRVLAKTLRVSPESLAASFHPASRAQLAEVAAMRLPDGSEAELAEDTAYLEWRYFGRDPAAVDLWVVSLDDRVLACIGLEVMDIKCEQGDRQRIRRLQDVIVSCEHRKLGLGAWLTLEVLERFPDVVAIGSNEQSRSISEKLFNRHEIQKYYKFPLKSQSIVGRRLGDNLVARFSAWSIDTFNQVRIRRSERNLSRSQKLLYFSEIGALVDHVATALPSLNAGSAQGWTPMRDVPYLRWRFAQHPRRSFEGTVLCEANGEAIAYLIWSRDTAAADGAATEAYLFDWRWNPERTTATALCGLLADCLRRLYRDNAAVLSALVTDQGTEQILKQAQFLFRATDPRFYVHEPEPAAGLGAVPGWNLTYADTDKLDLAETRDPLLAHGSELVTGGSVAPAEPAQRSLVLRRSDGLKAWKTLWKRCLAGVEHSYFVSWPWIEHWCRQLPEDIELYLIFVEVAGQRAAGVFGRHSVRRNGFVRSHGAFLHRTGVSPYDDLAHEYNLILNEAPGPELLQALITAIPFYWNEIYIIHADKTRMPPTLLDERCGPFTVRTLDRRPSYYVDLDVVRETEQGYLQLLSRNTRRSINRTSKRLTQLGALNLEAATSKQQALSMFDELCLLHQRHWQQKGLAGAFSDPWILAFHRSLINDRFHSGEIQLLRLRCGPKIVGCLYNFVYAGSVLFYQSGVNYAEFPDTAPGLICHEFAVAHNAELGHGRYDFLGGNVRYKRSLSTHANQLGSYVIQRRTPALKIEAVARRLRRRLRGAPPQA
ncbi:MAG: GNAT family N-acetyltransferase [Pseudomonadota bacterium]